jgi:pimeloyl-ACP methyl ester carboxylesterase
MNSIVSQTLLAGAALSLAGFASANASEPKPTVVLVHGGFADATGWSKVILRLEKAGYPTIAVQNPLSTLPEDIATTRRVIDSIKGPVVLVGHSYGGAVITGAGVGSPNVKSLVYISAFAPDAGEKVVELHGKFGPAPLGGALVLDSAGYFTIDRSKFHQVFAADVTDEEALVMAAAQKPFAGAAFAGSLENPAWKTIPSWYLVSTEDGAIPVELQRFMAKRIGARSIVEVKSSHVPYVSQPDAVVKLIEAAAQ